MNPPSKIFRLRYETPRVTHGESDPTTGYSYPGGEPVEDDEGNLEYQESVRYYLSRSSLNRKVKSLERWSEDLQLMWDPPASGRVLSIDEGTIDWMAPDGHGD